MAGPSPAPLSVDAQRCWLGTAYGLLGVEVRDWHYPMERAPVTSHLTLLRPTMNATRRIVSWIHRPSAPESRPRRCRSLTNPPTAQRVGTPGGGISRAWMLPKVRGTFPEEMAQFLAGPPPFPREISGPGTPCSGRWSIRT